MNSRNNKLSLLIFIPIVVGTTLLFTGIATQRAQLLTAGIAVLFGGGFLVAVIITICSIVSPARSKTHTAAESREDRKNEVLSEMRQRVAEETGETSSNTVEALNKLEDNVNKRNRAYRRAKALVILFIVSFISVAFVGVGLLSAGFMIAGGIVFACAPAMVVILFVVLKIKERVSKGGSARSGENYDRRVGYVKSCTVSRSFGSTTVYRVDVQVGGNVYSTYGKDMYDDGERVEISVKRNGRSAYIIGPTEYSYVRKKNDALPIGSDDPTDVGEIEDEDKPRESSDGASKSGEGDRARDEVLSGVSQLRAASDIEDADERRKARAAARQAMIDGLNKIKANRAEKENANQTSSDRIDNAEKVAAAELSEPTVPITHIQPSEPLSVSTAAVCDERADNVEPTTAEEKQNVDAAPTYKRAAVTYKAINRKK